MVKDIDVFLVGGQSNAQGAGTPSKAPTVPDGIAYEYRPEWRELRSLREPVGPHGKGSAWSAFALEYHARVGRPIAFVAKAAGGAAQHRTADLGGGHWDVGGEHTGAAIEALADCLDYLADREFNATFQGILWHQGESDAIAIEQGDLDAGEYRRAFNRMLDRFQDAFGCPTVPVFLFKLGRRRSGETEGFRAIREAQVELAREIEGVSIVYDDCTNFAEDGLMHDDLHYTQQAYNAMGQEGARRVAKLIRGDEKTDEGAS